MTLEHWGVPWLHHITHLAGTFNGQLFYIQDKQCFARESMVAGCIKWVKEGMMRMQDLATKRDPGTRFPCPVLETGRLLATTGDDDLPGDLQSLSWLTAVDVPRLQQMASGRVDLGGPCVPHPHPGALAGAADLHVGATPNPLLHGPAGMGPRGMPGLGPITSHGDSQMSQFPVGTQPSSGLQDPPPLYSPATQPQFPLPPGTQQCPPVGLYGPPFGVRPPYPQPHMAVHSSQELHPKHYPKPIYSYR
ncbi:Forkhead box protein N4 [Saguinus oedipus]|uniref:Forkhead box protein N4 n=1 Tax=Saguinus oedipus TaxID=9490 RepID=A0ABQ9UZX6_SAGOE|nr:Forkhead box protein N4 [Saguinus oedipus]